MKGIIKRLFNKRTTKQKPLGKNCGWSRNRKLLRTKRVNSRML